VLVISFFTEILAPYQSLMFQRAKLVLFNGFISTIGNLYFLQKTVGNHMV